MPRPPIKLKDVVLESGIEVKPVYGPEDVMDRNYERDVGNPGEFPFTRGIHQYMYRARPFTMRFPRARPASMWPLTCPRNWDSIPMTPGHLAMLAGWGWR